MHHCIPKCVKLHIDITLSMVLHRTAHLMSAPMLSLHLIDISRSQRHQMELQNMAN